MSFPIIQLNRLQWDAKDRVLSIGQKSINPTTELVPTIVIKGKYREIRFDYTNYVKKSSSVACWCYTPNKEETPTTFHDIQFRIYQETCFFSTITSI